MRTHLVNAERQRMMMLRQPERPLGQK